jgi:hypothetical protein
MSEQEEKLTEKIEKAGRSRDEPMGKKEPEAPFMLVGLSYYGTLAIALLIIALIFFLLR